MISCRSIWTAWSAGTSASDCWSATCGEPTWTGSPRRSGVGAACLRGPSGSVALDQVLTTVREIADQARGYLAGEPGSLDARVDVGGGLVAGTVQPLYGQALVRVGYGRLSARQRLASWLQLLALSAAHPDRPWRAVTVGRGGAVGAGTRRPGLGRTGPGRSGRALPDRAGRAVAVRPANLGRVRAGAVRGIARWRCTRRRSRRSGIRSATPSGNASSGRGPDCAY